MKKIIISTSVLLLIISLLFFYFDNKKKAMVSVQSKNEKYIPINFLSRLNLYKELSEYEKSLVDIFLKNNPKETKNLIYNDELGYKNNLLRYYDENTAIFCIPTGKIGCYIQFYDVKNWIKIDTKNIVIAGNEVVSNKYLIILSSNNILYFKSGMKDFEVVDNSKVVNENETYAKQSGMLDDYDFTFTENTQTLKVSVFKNKNKEDKANTKLREVEFVLP